MPHQEAHAADIAAAVESRPFCSANDRQVRTFDCDTGNASELSAIDLHEQFMAAADQKFIPAFTPAPAFT